MILNKEEIKEFYEILREIRNLNKDDAAEKFLYLYDNKIIFLKNTGHGEQITFTTFNKFDFKPSIQISDLDTLISKVSVFINNDNMEIKVLNDGRKFIMQNDIVRFEITPDDIDRKTASGGNETIRDHIDNMIRTKFEKYINEEYKVLVDIEAKKSDIFKKIKSLIYTDDMIISIPNEKIKMTGLNGYDTIEVGININTYDETSKDKELITTSKVIRTTTFKSIKIIRAINSKGNKIDLLLYENNYVKTIFGFIIK